MKILKVKAIRFVSFLSVVLVSSGVAFAATSDFSQTINSGTLTTSILDSLRAVVGSPSVSMSAKNFSFDCQAGGSASTGTFGSNSERLYATNGDAADNGWTLTLGATSGATARWANVGNTSYIDFNDPTGSTAGCADGGDADSTSGQLTVDPSVGTLTADCLTCTTTNVSKGSSAAFNQGTTDSITVLNAAGTSDDIWRGYLTGITVSQTIPAETPADTYTINLTLTATAQ
jgi:hypothetical protein